jgi:hypothetical protein
MLPSSAATVTVDPPLLVQEAAASSDQQLLAEYLDAIRLLTAAVHDDRKTKLDLVRLSDQVLEAQKVGERRWWCAVLKAGVGGRVVAAGSGGLLS